ncbi:hypothetical protein IQ265_11465 [Nodosilinea sp. LEGE 06152]|uniref:hypothetical protein n=1 Tax=Nodosilinea sp. LEGE 06152 TaxID=2777966 RepID=UPI00187F4D0F|nr:hypothetical protein [Nodosilinea sp. LEGE 06152]MBE9157437.1 hypothetical protein [Nodosilinea sp. LEGE 06152]
MRLYSAEGRPSIVAGLQEQITPAARNGHWRSLSGGVRPAPRGDRARAILASVMSPEPTAVALFE